jgi:hypothetical protein
LEKYNLNDIEPVRGGDKIKYIHLMIAGRQREDVLAFKDDKIPSVFEFEGLYDYKQQWDKTMMKPLTSVFEAMDWTIPDMSSQNIEEFFIY